MRWLIKEWRRSIKPGASLRPIKANLLIARDLRCLREKLIRAPIVHLQDSFMGIHRIPDATP